MKALKTTMAIAAVALLFATACSEKDTEWVSAPSISPTSAVVTAPDGGGTVSLTYTVSNPVDDAITTASGSASWISGISVPSDGTVTFTVAENPTLEPRTARITITYAYTLLNTAGTVSCDVTVAQSCGEDPAISVQPTAVAAGAEGGSYYFEYTIVNPNAEGSVDAATEADWITDIDTSTSGKVSFTVTENTGAIRESEITITYTYPGGTLSDVVEVVQDFPEGEVDAAPEISVTHPAITAAIEGGEYSFEYEVLNPADDGKMEVATEEDWITDLADSNGTVSFSVEENTSVLRSGVITLTYTYSEGSVSETVTVVQDHVSGATEGLPGIYLASGNAYAGSGVDAYTEWTLGIYEYDGTFTVHPYGFTGEFDYYIDGLVPSAEGDYDYYGDFRCSAAAYLDEDGNLVIPSQILNTTSSGYYLGWIPCVGFTSGSGWSYSSAWPELVFEYDDSDGSWKSDYGEFMGAFTSTTLTYGSGNNFGGFYDVVSPGITIKRVSGLTSLSATPSVKEKAGKSIENLELHTGAIAK